MSAPRSVSSPVSSVDRATLLKRIAAALLMTSAIALYFSDVS